MIFLKRKKSIDFSNIYDKPVTSTPYFAPFNTLNKPLTNQRFVSGLTSNIFFSYNDIWTDWLTNRRFVSEAPEQTNNKHPLLTFLCFAQGMLEANSFGMSGV